MSQLTGTQKSRIRRNRQLALQKRQEKLNKSKKRVPNANDVVGLESAERTGQTVNQSHVLHQDTLVAKTAKTVSKYSASPVDLSLTSRGSKDDIDGVDQVNIDGSQAFVTSTFEKSQDISKVAVQQTSKPTDHKLVRQLTREYPCEQCGKPKFVVERLFRYFGVMVCRTCRDDHSNYFGTILKTRARAVYLITEDALKGIPHVERPNTANPNWAPFKLYLRKHVQDWAYAKYGGPSGLEIERRKREDNNEKRRQRRNWLRKRNRPADDDSKYELNTLKLGRGIFMRAVPVDYGPDESDTQKVVVIE